MNLARIQDESVVEYPYSYSQLRKAHPSVSFPKELSDVDLSAFGVVCIQNTAVPDYDSRTQKVLEAQPTLVDGQWTQTWELQSLSADSIAEIDENQAKDIRTERNQRLADCDWTVLTDSPLTTAKKTEWKTYRTALRDIPSDSGFPHSVTWPTEPS